MSSNKQQLIEDIQKLLNSYKGSSQTMINPALLEFMDEKTLIGIIDSLLTQKEELLDTEREWLEQFKTK